MLSQMLLLLLCCLVAPTGQNHFQIQVDSPQKHLTYEVQRAGGGYEVGLLMQSRNIKPIVTFKPDKAKWVFVAVSGKETGVISIPAYVKNFNGPIPAKEIDKTWECVDGNFIHAKRNGKQIVITNNAISDLSMTIK